MRKQVILVDFENVQPDLLLALTIEDIHIRVFVGPQQDRLATSTVIPMQELGDRAKYVKVQKQGPDALDMHLAFYLGELSQQFPGAFFHIVAKDRDYDPLLEHLKSRDIFCAKTPSLESIPLFQRALAKTSGEQISAAVEWLRERPGNRLATQKTLVNSLKKVAFADRLDDEGIKAVVEGLVKQGYIELSGQKVHYLESLNVA